MKKKGRVKRLVRDIIIRSIGEIRDECIGESRISGSLAGKAVEFEYNTVWEVRLKEVTLMKMRQSTDRR